MASVPQLSPPTENVEHGNRGWYLLIGVLALAAALAFVFKASGKMPDFDVYWRAGARAALAEPLYRASDGHFQFKYLPAFAVLAVPLSALPPVVGKAIWFAVSIVLIAVLLRMSLRVLPDRRKDNWVLVVCTIVVLGKFYVHELVLGQVNVMFAAAIVAALVCMRNGSEALAGLLIVGAIVLKPHGALLLPWLGSRWRPRSIASAAIGMAVVLLLPAVLYGFGGNVTEHLAWWRTVVDTTAPNLLNPDNVSFLAMYSRWFGIGPAASYMALITVLTVMAAAVWVCLARRRATVPEGLEAGFLLIVMPLMSPQGWDYVLLIGTPAVMYLINYDDRLPPLLRPITIAALAIAGLAIFDVIGATAYRAFMRNSGITLCFLVMLTALVSLRARRVA